MSLERLKQALESNPGIKENLAPAVSLIAVAINRAIATLMDDYLERPDLLEPTDHKLLENEILPEGYEYSKVGDVMRRTTFDSNHSTGEIQNRFRALFEAVIKASEDHFFYYNSVGQLLLELELPENLKRLRAEKGKGADFKKAIQDWHNKNRKKVLPGGSVCPEDFDVTGYPFVAASTPFENKDTGLRKGHVDVALNVLNKKVKNEKGKLKYFDGEEVLLFDAIVEIAQAYDIPVAIAVGTFSDDQGTFKLSKDSFEEAKKYANSHPEVSKGFRFGAVGSFEESKEDPLVLAEMFCAYSAYLMDRLRKPVEDLESRLRKIDPSLPVGTFRDIAAVNAYKAGTENIKNAIKRFVSLNDDIIKSRLGKGPYGTDAWLAMLAYSFDLIDHGEDSCIGLNTYIYPQRIAALGDVVIEEQSYIGDESGLQIDNSDEFVVENTKKKWLTGATGAVSVVAGIYTAYQAGKEISDAGVSRRSFLKGLVGVAATTLPMSEVIGEVTD